MSEPHIERMQAELTELKERSDKLSVFIFSNPVFGALDRIDQALLQAQHGMMISYGIILEQRIERALRPV